MFDNERQGKEKRDAKRDRQKEKRETADNDKNKQSARERNLCVVALKIIFTTTASLPQVRQINSPL